MSKTILIIEDSKILNEMHKKKLESEGFEIVQAFDGIEGLAKVRSLKPDAIITDITMPKMDGFSLATLIKKSSDTKDIPIFIVTSLKGKEETVKNTNADGYFTKPVDYDSLIKTLKEYLG